LDVGAGSKKISRAVGALTVDINRKHKPDVVASILYLPFRDGCFETVSAFEVIEHLDNDELALQELIRVSRKKIILSVPNSFRHNLPLLPKKRRSFMSFDHKREYSLEEIFDLMSRLKLKVTLIKGIGYCLPLSFLNLYIGSEIFSALFPKFATYIYVECERIKADKA
jgi:SAM-dependent methyltransferase